MSLVERFPECLGGDDAPPEWKRHLALAAALIEIDALTARVRAMEDQVTNLEVARDDQYIDVLRLLDRVRALEPAED